MLNQPRSPNIFDAVHLTESKKHSPQGQDPSQNTFYFSKRLESITQFLDFLECNPENHTELTELELRWERTFFKEELKAALFLNYTLIKLHCQVNDELKQVKKDIQNRSERKKISQEFEKKLQWHTQTSENCQAHSNQITPSKKRAVRDAFEAQRKILQAKHQRECDELKKLIHQVEDMLRVSKQENQYMRGELLAISEKNYTLLNDNREAEDCKRRALEENKELHLKLEDFEKKQYHERKLNHLNCSPINRSIDAFSPEDAEISFNHEFFNENIIENKLLKKQIEEIQFELDQLKSQNARLQAIQAHNQHDQHMDVMQESCRLFLVELEKEYLDVKKQLQTSMAEIGKYKQIIKVMQENNAVNAEQQAKRSEIAAPQKDLCSICSILSKQNDTLKGEKKKIQAKYQALRQKFDKTLNLELIQRQQWDHFLKDLKSE